MAEGAKGLSMEVHDVGLAVIEIGRQLLHAPKADPEAWAAALEGHADDLEKLAVRVRTEGARAR